MSADHREVRGALGLYALQRLSPSESQGVRAHLDGCAACRAELAELMPLGELLAGVDADRLDEEPCPPPGLGAAVLSRIDMERRRGRRRTPVSRRVPVLAAAAALVLVLGGALGWLVRPATIPEVAGPSTTSVTVQTMPDAGVEGSADLVDHQWGMEVVLEGSGFTDGTRYTVQVVQRDGAVSTAGAFLGTGPDGLACGFTSAVPMQEAVAFQILDAEDERILWAVWG